MEAPIAKQKKEYSGAHERLPLIDINGITAGDKHRLREVADEIGQASREIGLLKSSDTRSL